MPTFWVRSPNDDRSVDVSTEEITFGRAEHIDVHVDDRRVSRAHCVVQRVAEVWLLRDLGSANGTFLNGVKIRGDAPLHDRDVITIGDTRIVVGLPPAGGDSTEIDAAIAAPRLTPREQEVLEKLCAPLFGIDPVAEPTSVRDIAGELVVSADAVKKILARLYEKFGISEVDGNRRLLLARAAVLSRAVLPPV